MSHLLHHNWRRAYSPFPYEQRFFTGTTTTATGHSIDMTPDGEWLVASSGRDGYGGSIYEISIWHRSPTSGLVTLFQQITDTSPATATEKVKISDDGLVLAATSNRSSLPGSLKIYIRTNTNNLFNTTPSFNQGEMLTYYGNSIGMTADANVIGVGSTYATVGVTPNRGNVKLYTRVSPGAYAWQAGPTLEVPQTTYPSYLSIRYGASIDFHEPLSYYSSWSDYNLVVGATADQAAASSVIGGGVFHGVIDYNTDPSNVYAFAAYNSRNYTAALGSSNEFGRAIATSKDGIWLAVAAKNYVRILEWNNSLTKYYTRWTSAIDTSGTIYGIDISDDGNTLAVGKPQKGTRGVVEVYKRESGATPDPDDWALTKTISPVTSDVDSSYGIWFGGDVELSADGSVLFTSAPYDDSTDLNRQYGEHQYGSLFVYHL